MNTISLKGTLTIPTAPKTNQVYKFSVQMGYFTSSVFYFVP